jgi:hypothetical protein
MTGQRVFTLEEVNALVPSLTALVGRQLDRRKEIETRLRSLAELTGAVPEDLTPDPNDSTQVVRMKGELAKRVAEYQLGWREVEELGGVLKDARTGLVDFYGRVDDRIVWLCWRYGEQEISHYHALDEGFSGRKALKGSVRIRTLN